MARGDMLVIIDEIDDFYAVQAPAGIKAYIYRTYVLDGAVEGNRVNLRLNPSMEAPVIAQLNAGDPVEGPISAQNTKWIEVNPPASTRFYVSRDYIEKVGDADYLTKYEKRKEEVSHLLNSASISSQSELQKPFPDIESEKVIESYQKIINDYKDFPEKAAQAKEHLAKFQDAYLYKKVEYLESKTKTSSNTWKARNAKLTEEMQSQKARLSALEQQLQESRQSKNASRIYEKWVTEKYAAEVSARMALWIPVEIAYYERWIKENNGRSIQEFYDEQHHEAIALRGVLEAYERPVKNRPGDFLLVNRANRLPIAYLYSTQVNLQDKIGQEVTLKGALRHNNNFAYPAYFILSEE
jgi:hypothetical protein